jgi:hypothetical protein
MTSNETRATTLMRVLRAGVANDRQTLHELLTDDVRAWTPALSTESIDELIEQLDLRDEAFSGVELDVSPLDVGGDYACVEWSVLMTHTGVLTLDDATVVEPTDTRVTLHGVTVAEFRGERICSLRQYWDEFAVLEQLGVLRNDPASSAL